MKTQAYTTKTRSKLRSLVKLMKKHGLNVVSNERTRQKGDQWGVIVSFSETPVLTRKKRFNVVNGQAVAV